MAKPHEVSNQKRNIVVLDESAERLNVAQTGLVPPDVPQSSG